jgi:hypothetical protein
MDTPMPDSAAARVERTADLKLRDDGSMDGKLKVSYRGQEALSLRLEERQTDEVARKKFLEDQIKEAVPTGIEVELTNQPNWGSSDFTLVAEFSLKVPGLASNTGHRTIIPAGLFVGPEKHLFEHSDRVHPIYLSFGFKKIDNINIQLPKGWSVEASRRRPGRKSEYSSRGAVRFDAGSPGQIWSAERLLPDSESQRSGANRGEARQRCGEQLRDAAGEKREKSTARAREQRVTEVLLTGEGAKDIVGCK